MSYKAKCEKCDCPISMEDDFEIDDDRRCEECRSGGDKDFVSHMDDDLYSDDDFI